MESCLLRTPLVNVQKLLGDGGGGELATGQETCLLRTPLVNVQKLSVAVVGVSCQPASGIGPTETRLLRTPLVNGQKLLGGDSIARRGEVESSKADRHQGASSLLHR